MILTIKGLLIESADDISIFGYRPIIVITSSMVPAIEVNSISILKYCDINDIEIGDIVAYTFNDLKITHRVIDKVKDIDGSTYLKTKGDSNTEEDIIKITSDMVDGKIIKTYNNSAPLISKFMLVPGEVNPTILIRTMILLMVSVVILGILLFHTVNLIITIMVAYKNNDEYNEYIDKYNKICDRQVKLKEKVGDIGRYDYTKDRAWKKALIVLLKARVIREIRGIEDTIDDFERIVNSAIKLRNK